MSIQSRKILIFKWARRISAFMPRKHFTTSLDDKLLKDIKKLAIDLDRSVNDLLEEGITHLLKKYEKKPKK